MALIDGLVSYYKFDSDTNDSVGTKNLTNNGATFSGSGKINGCFDFDGLNDTMTSSNSTDYQLPSFSINFWLKPDTNATQKMVADTMYVSGSNEFGWYIQYRTTNVIRFNLALGSGSTNCVALTSSTISTGNWYMITCTYDGTTPRVYINGTEATYSSQTTGTIAYTVGQHSLSLSKYINQFFDGKLDEIGLWSRELTSIEITTLYNSGNGLQYPFGSSGYSNTINGISSYSKINGIDKANISKVNGI